MQGDLPLADGAVAGVAVVYEPRLRCQGGDLGPGNLGQNPGAVWDRAVGEIGAAVEKRAEGALQELALDHSVACQKLSEVLETDKLLASL